MSEKQIYKIVAPNPNHSRVTAGVGFYQGIGYTENEAIIKWFKEHGYDVSKTSNVDDSHLVKDLTKQIETLTAENEELKSQLEVDDEEEEDDDGEGASSKPNNKGKGGRNVRVSK